MSQSLQRQQEDTNATEPTTVGVRPLLFTNGSFRMTLTPAKDEVDLVEGDNYVIKTRDDGSILLEPQ